MSFDLDAIRQAVARHGAVARVVVASVRGSTPREVGAAMLIWEGGQSGTIGGGALEFQAASRALHHEGLSQHPLGPELGQCCGGSVTLLTERFDAGRLVALAAEQVVARGPGEMPLSVRRLMARARAQGVEPKPQLLDGWMVEPVLRPSRALWLWGAGHVGRALVGTLSPLPDFSITWIDTAADRFPEDIPAGVTTVPAAQPASLVKRAPEDAEHLIVTHTHSLDLELCHSVLGHGFGFCGVIGSETKWARFRKRLIALGHPTDQIDRICCPIGQKSLGKHPQAIAISVGSQLLNQQKRSGDTCQTSFLASGA